MHKCARFKGDARGNKFRERGLFCGNNLTIWGAYLVYSVHADTVCVLCVVIKQTADRHEKLSTTCNTLQQFTTHRNTLLHTATYCSTLWHTAPADVHELSWFTHVMNHVTTNQQHAATHCNTLQHTATHCSIRINIVNSYCKWHNIWSTTAHALPIRLKSRYCAAPPSPPPLPWSFYLYDLTGYK